MAKTEIKIDLKRLFIETFFKQNVPPALFVGLTTTKWAPNVNLARLERGELRPDQGYERATLPAFDWSIQELFGGKLKAVHSGAVFFNGSKSIWLGVETAFVVTEREKERGGVLIECGDLPFSAQAIPPMDRLDSFAVPIEIMF